MSNSASEYIVHHLTNLTNHTLPGAHGAAQSSIIDFSYINWDTLFFSSFLGALMCYGLWRAAKQASAKAPGRFLCAVEILVEFVDGMSKEIIPNDKTRRMMSPMALTLLIWIFMMNFMDLLPIDLIPRSFQAATGDPHAFIRPVPTADINLTLSLSGAVLILSIYYGVKIHGLGGWLKGLLTAPFGKNPLLWVFNFALNIVEYLAKMVSHGLRLFGNMYAGEMVFMLIAMLGGYWMSGHDLGLLDPIMYILHLFTGAIWTIFHVLIISIQAFIFSVLALIYVGQAHESH